jgi:hypothetical protein
MLKESMKVFRKNKALNDEGLLLSYARNSSWVASIGWFSVINVGVNLLRLDVYFLLGLGISLVLGITPDAVNISSAQWPFIGASVLISGVFILLGYFVKRQKVSALMVALILYALDTILVAVLQQWLMLVFHVLGLYNIAMAYYRLQEIRRRTEQPPAGERSVNDPMSMVGSMALQGQAVALNYDPKRQCLTRVGSTIRNISAVHYLIKVGEREEFRNIYDDIPLVTDTCFQNPASGGNWIDLLDFGPHPAGINVRIRRMQNDICVYDISEDLAFPPSICR